MARFFNTAGPCESEWHYMLPPEARLGGVRQLIERRQYFVVHAPRQTGKTTGFMKLARELTASGQYAALLASCETGQSARDDVEAGVGAVIQSLGSRSANILPEELCPLPVARFAEIAPSGRLHAYLSAWSRQCPLPVILFLDEIDSLQDDSLLSVLRQLRSGYLDRPSRFPATIVLIGLRDVRDYRVGVRSYLESLGTSSPFNIKVESVSLRNFTANEVADLLTQHTDETGQVFTDEALARVYALTDGQPWLVNALARQAVEVIVPRRTEAITVDVIEQAKERLILRRDTHLDSLVDRLREPRVQRVIEPIIAGQLLDPNVLDDDIGFVQDLGLVKPGARGLEIANPIYREVVPRALTAVLQQSLPVDRLPYITADGGLDVQRILEDFREFWCEHAEFFLERQPYSEAAAQIVFMAYLQRVVNGGGLIDREYGVGSGRIDLCVHWPRGREVERFAMELKVWRDRKSDPLSRGLEQLTAYLERLSLERGTLIIFDGRGDAPPLLERSSITSLEHKAKQITIVRL